MLKKEIPFSKNVLDKGCTLINISYFTSVDPPSLENRYKVEGFRYNFCYRNSTEALADLKDYADMQIIIYKDTGKRETEIYRGAADERAVKAVEGIEEWEEGL